MAMRTRDEELKNHDKMTKNLYNDYELLQNCFLYKKQFVRLYLDLDIQARIKQKRMDRVGDPMEKRLDKIIKQGEPENLREVQMASKNLNLISDKHKQVSMQYSKSIDMKEQQDQKKKDWTERVKQVEEIAARMGISEDDIQKYYEIYYYIFNTIIMCNLSFQSQRSDSIFLHLLQNDSQNYYIMIIEMGGGQNFENMMNKNDDTKEQLKKRKRFLESQIHSILKQSDFQMKNKKKELEKLRMQVDNFDPLLKTKEEDLVIKRQEIVKLESKFNRMTGNKAGSPSKIHIKEYDQGIDDNQPNEDNQAFFVTDDQQQNMYDDNSQGQDTRRKNSDEQRQSSRASNDRRQGNDSDIDDSKLKLIKKKTSKQPKDARDSEDEYQECPNRDDDSDEENQAISKNAQNPKGYHERSTLETINQASIEIKAHPSSQIQAVPKRPQQISHDMGVGDSQSNLKQQQTQKRNNTNNTSTTGGAQYDMPNNVNDRNNINDQTDDTYTRPPMRSNHQKFRNSMDHEEIKDQDQNLDLDKNPKQTIKSY